MCISQEWERDGGEEIFVRIFYNGSAPAAAGRCWIGRRTRRLCGASGRLFAAVWSGWKNVREQLLHGLLSGDLQGARVGLQRLGAAAVVKRRDRRQRVEG